MIKAPVAILFTTGGLPVETVNNKLNITGSVGIDNNNQKNPLWVTGSFFQNIQTITGSVTIPNIVSVRNFYDSPIGSSASLTGPLSAGTDGVFARTILTDTSGKLIVTGALTANVSFPLTQSVLVQNASLPVSVSNFPIIQSITGSVTVANNLTGAFAITNVPTVTGSVTVPNIVQVTGSTQIVGIPTITGSITVPNLVSITGAVGITNLPLT